MIKKILCALLVLLTLGCMSAAIAEGCFYESDEYPCDVVWQYDSTTRQHRRVCLNHVEDKEDPFSYMPVTEWEDCTLDEGGECTVCGHDYIRDPVEPEPLPDEEMDIMALEEYLAYCEENGIEPFKVSASGSKLSLSLSDDFQQFADEMGIPASESLLAKTTATLTLPGGLTYPATGEAVEPETELVFSEYGPGKMMLMMGMMDIAGVTYSNNVNPGTATVTMDIYLMPGDAFTLQLDFTIEGVAAEYCIYGSPASPCKIIWSVRSDEMIHRRVCYNHREKEDYNEMVPVTDWESCTPGEGGVCTGCGFDYDGSDNEMGPEDILPYMVEMYCRTAAEFGEAINATVSGNQLTFSMRDEFFAYLEEEGIPVPEAMYGTTTYTLLLTNGSEFAATGEPITPEASLRASEGGPGHWLDETGLMSIGKIVYADNVEPGTGTASVTFEYTMGIPYTISVEFTIRGNGPYCKYGSASSPCDIIWNAENKQHASFCLNHVEVKEDPNSFVQVTEWEDCVFTENEYICDICGADYTPAEDPDVGNPEEEILKLYNELTEKQGRAPIYIEHSKDHFSIEFNELFIMYLLEHGIQLPESLSGTTRYVFTLKGGDSFAYTGEEIRPEIVMTGNGVGPGAWLEENELIYIRKVTYTDNVEPGQATAEVLFFLVGDGNLLFKLNFTITGEGGGEEPRVPGDADGDNAVSLSDALELLRAIAGEDVSISSANADVNGDGKVDIHDVLLILQYLAGWNVSLT